MLISLGISGKPVDKTGVINIKVLAQLERFCLVGATSPG